MALANVTPRASVSMEEMLFLVDNITNGSSANTTVALQPYPSGYTLPQIVVASTVVTLLMIAVVVGNMLVIIAITTEKALKNIQNWFIASLAVADFFLGLVIMPFSLANELMGYWIFGAWCITQAVEYLKKRTPMRAIVMITAVWLLSALICIPPLLGWKVERTAEEQYPKCQLISSLTFLLTHDINNTATTDTPTHNKTLDNTRHPAVVVAAEEVAGSIEAGIQVAGTEVVAVQTAGGRIAPGRSVLVREVDLGS
ncbi:unnamed protein product [Phaedon cochleariae]|uniref:G-protein coupled receptors family 1 profile domain-containing protein n=1 Tax=Phaedon cochleariae TaxID=80249 RepID=A0A9N9SF98_PHACE|nr:unnamed protein product [Phaedon cochleariae]